MLRIGLTGGIGCGKSLVAQHFAALNVPFIDADQIAHHLTAQASPVLDAIQGEFGCETRLPGGGLNRSWLRQRIFSDSSARKKLEAILHPLIRDEMRRQLEVLHDVPYVLLVIPLLLETQMYRPLIDRVLVVDCLEEQQRARVHERNGLAMNEIDAILAAQMTRAQRLQQADDVLVNSGEIADLSAQIQALHQSYIALAAKKL